VLASGHVVSLHRWPVKSMGGERVGALDTDVEGAAGDRAHALFEEHRGSPRRLSIREAPRMVLWHATYGQPEIDRADPPLPALTAPDGTRWTWGDPGLKEAIEADLGRPVELRRDPTLLQDLADSLLLTTAASHADVEAHVGPLDLRRWRTNVHVELDAGAFAESGWEGAEMTIGAARFALLHPCIRCVIPTRDPDTSERKAELLRWLARERGTIFGINARALGPGRIAEGDRVEIRQP